ncbi:MAG: response regulator [Deltaproteobacteria bacterium]|nr:response regulator [Deltaproteobacteria bacterium]
MTATKKKVMIIDGDPTQVEAFRKLLSEHYEVTTVATPKEAIDKAKTEDFDVIVNGYILPMVTGPEGIKEVRTLDSLMAEEKAAILKKMRDAVLRVESEFQTGKAATEELLKHSQAQLDNILDLLNGRILQLETEKAQLQRDINGLKDEVKTASVVQAGAEQKARDAIAAMNEALNKAGIALQGKTEAEKKMLVAIEAKAQAESQVKIAQAEKAEAEKEMMTAIEAKAQAESQTQIAQSEKAQSEKARQDALSQHSEAKTQAQESLDAKAKAEADYASLQKRTAKEIESVTKEISAALNDKTRAEEQTEAALREKVEAERKLSIALNDRSRAEQQAEMISQVKDQVQKDLDAALAKKVEMERSVQSLQSVKAKLEEDLPVHQARAAREVEAFKRDINNLNNELRKAVMAADSAAGEKAVAVQKAETVFKEKNAVEKKLATVLTDLEESEKQVAAAKENAQKNTEALTNQVALLKNELERAITMAEAAVKEKLMAEEKLTTIQKRWEQYMASR